MTTKKILRFEIFYKQILDENGELNDQLPEFAEEVDEIILLYRHMWLTRIFDQKAISLQRMGKLGTYPSTMGQEAIATAVGSSMQSEDVLCPYYRENAAHFWRGVSMEEILLYWGGNEEGSNFSQAREDLPICVPISSQNLHAVGIALAFKLRKEQRAVVVFVGDGGTSRGDFYEAMNFAGVMKLPVVFMVNNNQWAISVPSSQQTAALSFVQKGIAAGIDGVQVDGNDILVLRTVIDAALEKAYDGGGPTIIEAKTYRMCRHTTADDASRYRENDELIANQKYDPILRVRKYLESINMWDEEKEQNLLEELKNSVNSAANEYLNHPKQNPESMFDYLYEQLPEALETQRSMVKK